MSDQTKTLLLVEAEKGMARLETKTLKEAGYEVILAESGEEALAIVKNNPGIDLILMDIDLGQRLDGPQTAQMILKDHDIPVVFLTSHAEQEMVEKVRHISRYGYVMKASGGFVLLSSIEMALTLFDANKKLRTSEQKYRQIIENLSEGVWVIDKEAVTTFVNPQMAKMLGYTPQEMIGKHLFAFMDEPGVQDATQKLERRKQGVKERHDFKFRRKDGTQIDTILEAAPVLDPDGNYSGAIAGVKDITERVQIEETLKKSEALLNEMGKMAKVGGWEFSVDLHEQVWTEEVYRIHEVEMTYQPNVSKGIDFYPPAARPIIAQAVQRAIDLGEPFDLELEFITAKGNPRWVNVIGKAELENGKSRKVRGTIYDITERKRAEKEIKALLQEKELLLREVHHRIKNNMNTIISLLKFQADALKDPSAITALEDASNRVFWMMGIYDKLFHSKDYRNINVKEYLSDVIQEIALTFSFRKKVRLEKEIDNITLNTKIVFPLGIMINELITNAFNYAFPDDCAGTIQVSLLVNEEKQLELIVRDNGIGLPEAIQISSCESIGLNLVNIFARQIGATVELVRGNGTEYKISCPLENN